MFPLRFAINTFAPLFQFQEIYYLNEPITTHFHIAQTRYCVDISVCHRYIGDDSVYRRSFEDKFVTIRAMGGDKR